MIIYLRISCIVTEPIWGFSTYIWQVFDVETSKKQVGRFLENIFRSAIEEIWRKNESNRPILCTKLIDISNAQCRHADSNNIIT